MRAIPTRRLRWFTGRFLTARDLTDEQDYHLGRHRLHNRLLHGWGTVCGLEVRPHDRPDCAHEWVRVNGGIALDCRGREIVVDHGEAVHWPLDPSRTTDEDGLAVLCVEYRECLDEPLPAIVSDCTHGGATEPGRVVERWAFHVHPVTDADDRWSRLVRGGADGDGAPCGCGDGASPEGCLEPACELGDCVPIALLSRCRGEAVRIDVDLDGVRRRVRRSLPPPAATLTHVVGTSWEHGQELEVDALAAAGGELRVTCDRALDDGDQGPPGVGVDPYTFLVEVEDSTGSRERLPFDPDHPPRVEGRDAVFTLHPDLLRVPEKGNRVRRLVGDTIFVALDGDLVHDCHQLPVDADFFGRFPSGDGVQGGVLRSWFFVTDRKEAGT